MRSIPVLLCAALWLPLAARAQVTPVDPALNVTPDASGPTAQTTPPSLSGISGGGAVELGQTVMLTVQFYGSGTDQTYQWKKNGVAIAGATAVSYTIPAAAAADAGTYTVTVTNPVGASVATTDLTVKPLAPIVITWQPYSVVVQVNQPASFAFSATGSYPRTYQWRRDGVAITGATTASYTIPAVTTADAAAYSVVVSNSQGSATSTSASLTVNAATPPVISTYYPGDTTLTVGNQLVLNLSLTSGSSPFTYQWMKNGSAIAGATTVPFTIPVLALTDAGKYSVTVTNIAGSATSREATVVVNPPTPIAFSTQPQSQTLYEGQSLNLYSYAGTGSPPITYQWQKDNVAIAGATNTSFSINAVALADGGVYKLVATNPAGVVSSNGATIVVNPAIAPAITTAPLAQSLSYGAYLNLSVQVSGSAPLQYQWKKDGVALTGATYGSYSVSSVTPSNAGQYTVTVTNRAGSVTSSAALVSVADPVLPVITTQPVAQQVALGLSAAFSVQYNSAGAGPLTLQWTKNGVVIPNATYSSYSLYTVKDSDAGDYAVVLTGAAGSVTSSAVHLTVLPAAAPSIAYWPSSTVVTLGQSASLSIGTPNGSPPFTYQWYKDGVAIAGATGSSYYISSATVNDLGTYVLQISNDGGIAASPGIRVRQATSAATTPWTSVARLGDVIYFLGTQPSRIERYDLVGEKWLPTVNLSDTLVPTAFAPATEGVYIAYGRALMRRSSDLSTETALLNATDAINQIFLNGDWLYYRTTPSGYSSSSTLQSLRRSNLQAGSTVTAFANLVFASNGRGFGNNINPGSYTSEAATVFTANSDGTFTGVTLPYRYNYYQLPNGSRMYLIGNESYVTSTGGSVFKSSDLTYVAALGEPFTDLVERSDGGLVLLRDNVLQAVSGADFSETGRASLAFSGVRAFGHGTDVFAFGAKGGGTAPFSVTKVPATAFAAVTPASATNGAGERYSVDSIFYGNGVVEVFSRSKQAVVRWSTQSRSYLSAVPLRGNPRLGAQKLGSSRALFAYDDGIVTALPLTAAASAETQIGNVGNRPWDITDLGGGNAMLNLYDYGDSGDFRLVLGAQGRVAYLSSFSYWGAGLGWNDALRRLYSNGQYSWNQTLSYEPVATDGSLATSAISSTVSPLLPPVRGNADGSLLVTANGRVLNADLAAVGTLSNNITDGAWLSTGLYTLRVGLSGEAEVQRWAKTTYLLADATPIPGTPQRIFAISDTQLVVVTTIRGYLSFTLVNADLSIVTPPTPATYAGAYLGKVGSGGSAGDFALYLRANGTGVFLANLGSGNTALVATDLTLNADGSFVTLARDVASGLNRTVVGVVATDGTVGGSVSSLSLTFTGAKTTGSAATAGYYAAPALNGGMGASYAICGADGRTVFVAQNGTVVDGAAGTATNGAANLTSARGTVFSLAMDGGSGSFSATAASGGFANTTFGALRDGVQRTDRLANISTRGQLGTGDDTLIAGFVITGTASRTVLIRAVGPTLANWNVTNYTADPAVALFHDKTQIAQSDNWSSEPNAATIAAAASSLGAFPLPSPGKEAALYVTLDPGTYTAQVSSVTGDNGLALVEVYDAGSRATGDGPRVVNISTRGRVGSGDNALICGFVVSGNSPKKILVRAIGPTLASYGVGGTIDDPTLTVMAGQTVLLTNDDWGTQSNGVTPADISAASVSVGAFGLVSGSKDAAVILTLPAGNYTVLVTGKGTATGVGLVEVYEVQ